MRKFTVHWSNTSEQRAQTPLVVLLHGYGADEQDLAALVQYLPSAFTYASVQAPIAMDSGFTWFPVYVNKATGSVEFSGKEEEVLAVLEDLCQWVDSVKEHHTSVSLLGFSMGMIMATCMMRVRPKDYRCVVGLSGFVLDRLFPHDEEVKKNKIPFFWGRDPEDPVIEKRYIDTTVPWLNEYATVKKIAYSGIGHSISLPEIKHVHEFLSHYAK